VPSPVQSQFAAQFERALAAFLIVNMAKLAAPPARRLPDKQLPTPLAAARAAQAGPGPPLRREERKSPPLGLIPVAATLFCHSKSQKKQLPPIYQSDVTSAHNNARASTYPCMHAGSGRL
jgi:hypothetical protein